MDRNGKIHIYMGEGKGKTTAAAGLAVRCAGTGGQVLFGQLMKSMDSGELVAFEEIDAIQMMPAPGFFGFTWEMTPADKEAAVVLYRQYLESLAFRANQGNYRMIVLDEAISAVTAELLSEEDLLDWIDQLPDEAEVVLTGRYPSEKMIEAADYVTEMRKVKHPFDKGLNARRGIEF